MDFAKITVRFMLIPVFVKLIDIKKIKTRLNNDNPIQYEELEDNEKSAKDDGIETQSRRSKRFLIACVLRISGRIRLRALDCRAIIGTGDAASAAMIAGSVKIAFLQACAFFGFDKENIEITPEYYTERLFLDFFGIISLCFADIILAVLGALYDIIRKRSAKRSYYANTVTE